MARRRGPCRDGGGVTGQLVCLRLKAVAARITAHCLTLLKELTHDTAGGGDWRHVSISLMPPMLIRKLTLFHCV